MKAALEVEIERGVEETIVVIEKDIGNRDQEVILKDRIAEIVKERGEGMKTDLKGEEVKKERRNHCHFSWDRYSKGK